MAGSPGVWVVALLGLAAMGPACGPRGGDARVSSIAVLPFSPAPGDESQGHLTIGMADAIITRLASVGRVRVPPTTTIRHFAGSTRTAADIGRELGVDAVLDGTLRRSGERVSVQMQLTRVRDGSQIWAARFDERFTGIFAVQDAITEQVASSLLIDMRGASPRMTADTEAYEIYLHAREQWARRTAASIRTAIGMYQQAIDKDPAFARAYAGLADSYSLTASGIPPAERFPKARAAALKALQLDDTLAEAHNALAFLSYKADWKWDVSESAFKRAIELDPDYVLAHHWYGEFLSIIGRNDAGLAELRRARELDPYSVAIQVDLGAAFVRAKRPDEAIATLRLALDADPTSAALHNGLVNALRVAGRHDEAFETQVRLRVIGGATAPQVAALRAQYAKEGWDGLTRVELARLLEAEKKADPRIVNVSSIAGLIARQYATLRDDDNALDWMEEAARRRDDGPLTIRHAWYWEPYRDHPRIKAIEMMMAMPLP